MSLSLYYNFFFFFSLEKFDVQVNKVQRFENIGYEDLD